MSGKKARLGLQPFADNPRAPLADAATPKGFVISVIGAKPGT